MQPSGSGWALLPKTTERQLSGMITGASSVYSQAKNVYHFAQITRRLYQARQSISFTERPTSGVLGEKVPILIRNLLHFSPWLCAAPGAVP